MNSNIARFFAAVLMFLAPFLLTNTTKAADASLVVTGAVVTPAGAPWDGVKIELVLVEDKAKEAIVLNTMTDSDGAFQLTGSQRAVYRVRITPWKDKVVMIPLGDQSPGSKADLGVIKIKISCSDPGVFCDEIKPREK